ncbi:PQQ-binding-like beta-propeller repeat protein [Thalassomonas sp. M1454]|uniref:outer membrane protein assembly factor BamB family protein n=1 Tax=Thalassomonas sp. M1454 TaxID=2594477 RepID=UPI00163DAC8A|nr:PQQ-binding-like beta-propeller repeat protein [Thalassomonas sp. M1454]
MNNLKTLLLLAITSYLLGCGGGSSDSGPNIDLKFNPGSISADLIETETEWWPISVTVTGDIADIKDDVYIYIVDDTGVISTDVYIRQNSQTSYSFELNSKDNLSPGEYKGNIAVKLCKNSSCSSEYKNSPWLLPFDIKVKSHTNLTNRTYIPEYQGWYTTDGNNARTRFVPVNLDPSEFSPRWLWKSPREYRVTKLMTHDEFVYLFEDNKREIGSDYDLNLVAISEETGTESWHTKIPAYFFPHSFTVNEGNIFLTKTVSMNRDEIAEISKIDASNGTILNQKQFIVTEEEVDNGKSITLGRVLADLGNLYFSENNEQFSTDYDFNESWSRPSVGGVFAKVGGNLYAFNSEGITILDSKNGNVIKHIILPDDITNYAPQYIISGSYAIIKTTREIIGYDIENDSIKWEADIPYRSYPHLAVGNGTLFIAANASVKAVDIKTGDEKWSKTIEDNATGRGSLILTNNILFISSEYGTIAIDINTQKLVWGYPFGGQMAISKGSVLYITRYVNSFKSHVLAAINLN